MTMVLESGLDAAQREVVSHVGPLLVVGGPGTGKTTSLVERWVHLATGVTEPHRVLLLVGRRDQALALRDVLPWRLERRAIVEVPVHTWHALAYHLVTRFHRPLGYRDVPVLLTAAEQWGVVRDLLATEPPDRWGPYAPSLNAKAFVDEVADFCLRAGQRTASDDELRAIGGDASAAAAFCVRYRAHLRETARLDAAGIVGEAARLLVERDDLATSVRLRFPHVLVDDAQDLSPVQLHLLSLLARTDLVCATDRPVDGLFPVEPATIRLEICHRYGSAIGTVASRLASHDPVPQPSPVAYAGPDSSAEVRVLPTLAAEIAGTARELRAAHLAGVPYERMAVLLAQPGAYAAPLRRALDTMGVPSRVAGTDRHLAAEAPVRHLVDLCRTVLDPSCPEDVLRGVLASPVVGCAPHVVRDLARLAFKERVPLREVVATSEECEEYRRLAALVGADPSEPADATFDRVFRESRWTQQVVARRRIDREAADTVSALAGLARALGRFVERRRAGTMLDYLESSGRSEYWTDAWSRGGSGARTGVAVLSLGAAAGDEWDVVCVLGVGEGQVPRAQRSQRLFDPWTRGGSAVERVRERVAEERRTLGTAITRARSRLVVSCSPGPSGRVTPSRFVEEAFGVVPEAQAEAEHPEALTLGELESMLRRALADPDAADSAKAAAAAALAAVPGVDPSSWWWRWDWTDHPAPLATGGKLTTSYSRIGTYENCPLQYVLRSVLGLDPETTYQMKFGSLVHKVIELTELGEITEWEQALRTYKDGFDPADYPNLVFARTYYRSGVRMLKLWWRSERVEGETVAVEYSFNDLDLDGHTIRGRIDRIAKSEQGLRLVDYKTSRSMLAWDKAKKSLQLAIYYLAAKTYEDLKKHGDPYRMLLVYPAYPDFDDPNAPAKRYQTPELAEETLEDLKVYLAEAVEERFAPSPEADCQWCKMRPLCPRWPEGREIGG